MDGKCSVDVLWGRSHVKGKIKTRHCRLDKLEIIKGDGCTEADGSFDITGGDIVLRLTVGEATVAPGAFSSIIHLATEDAPCSFLLRDTLYPENPVYVPEYKVAITKSSSAQSYAAIASAVEARNLQSDFARYEQEPEESYASAKTRNRVQNCPTWLGVPRDMRIFRVNYQDLPYRPMGYWGEIVPVNHSLHQTVELNNEKIPHSIYFEIGQGSSCRALSITRRLEDDCLPILHGTQQDDDVLYNLTFFATLEKQALQPGSIRGSDALTAYAFMGGNMLTSEQREAQQAEITAETTGRDEQVVLCARIEAVNTGKVPRYAWFKMPHSTAIKGSYNGQAGFCQDKATENVIAVVRSEGVPAPQEEMAVLIQPGERTCVEMYIPHSPVSQERAAAISSEFNFDRKFAEVKKFWQERLKQSAEFSIPEKPINDLLKAGILHCDIATIGLEPDDTAAATIGWYAPIGTESAPIIQYFDSVGLHKLAERSIEFFFKRQLESGFIQNFNNYQSETGPLLWTVGEHFRYTGDTEWLKRIIPHVKKAVDYLLQWRERNKHQEQKEQDCYGLVDGKVADPDDFYHSFFLNSGTYVGLKRIAEVYKAVEPDFASSLEQEVRNYKEDIRTAFYKTQAKAPVIPTGDGSWGPLMPPWTEYTGGITLYSDGGNWFSHGSFASRSAMTGALWLILSEVLDAEELGSTFLLKTNQTPITIENAGLSQPYYCRHDFAHIKRGEVKPFLKTFYNQLTGLIDQETYTFWEHYYHASQHKTHEEGWFLMQSRWMLYLEENNTLKLFSAIPRAWLDAGQKVSIDNAVCYFGKLSVSAKADDNGRGITAKVCCKPGKLQALPEKVLFRLPHPQLKPVSVSGGTYDAATETVVIDNFKGCAEVSLKF